ncbi:hypothetical protein V494_00014 [Pseudogymnoascus sp. VKM F-4513 (FW-928)]|nr:hypothetical protein V494_00014 [Pseudogymnoascus sp. VKM F-4513 (FW-928)]
MAEILLYTASHTLQGKEVRDKFDGTFADLYHDLDMGFSPINFMLHWAPLPHNRARDHAQITIAKTYMEIIANRRAGNEKEKLDIMWQLMRLTYEDGTPVPDEEIAHMMIAHMMIAHMMIAHMMIAHMMIALLMASQHTSSSSSSWIMLRLASRPDIIEELYQ